MDLNVKQKFGWNDMQILLLQTEKRTVSQKNKEYFLSITETPQEFHISSSSIVIKSPV